MTLFKKGLFSVIVLFSLSFIFPKHVFADWCYDKENPTATITVTCGTGTTDIGSNTCNAGYAIAKIDYADVGCRGLQTISHTVEGTTASNCTPTISTDPNNPTASCSY